ncbi:hypothetical protein [Gluconacetobacter asukensis]|uniref:Uncharacterized protein n=1 Tax=Gluconacetobacter asukensis TaxID=1017181 RepID=A0A7W4P090_9PROT|nr:hypothetical protein [Gluconacetobacter asukensis]MBB2172856.1 hypothetical protein [Gluconacetobacter asukensis]
MTRPTPAQQRVLRKAMHAPVMIWGAFSGVGGGIDLENPRFDRRHTVEMCIGQGWLTPAEGFNQYAITDKGRSVLPKRRRDK